MINEIPKNEKVKTVKIIKGENNQFVVRVLKTSIFPPMKDEWMTYKDYVYNKKMG